MHGEKLQMWLTNFKIALVEKNIDKLGLLMDSLPSFETKVEMKEALYLIKEASELVNSLKNKTSNSMKQMKKNLHYLKATHNKSSNTLDIRS